MVTYIAAFIPERTGGYSVIFSDMELATQGNTLDEAFRMASEALHLHLDGLIEDGRELPRASDMNTAKQRIAIWCAETASELPDSALYQLVPAEITSQKLVRVNISLPEYVLERIDRKADDAGMNRSAFLVAAALGYVPQQI